MGIIMFPDAINGNWATPIDGVGGGLYTSFSSGISPAAFANAAARAGAAFDPYTFELQQLNMQPQQENLNTYVHQNVLGGVSAFSNGLPPHTTFTHSDVTGVSTASNPYWGSYGAA